MAQTDVATVESVLRRKLDAGLLPRQRPEKTIATYGAGEPCTVCDVLIGTTQVEWRLRSREAVTHRFHIACHRLWEAECLKRGYRVM